MSFQTHFDNWQFRPPPGQHSECSPNLRLVLAECQRRWPFLTNMGCYNVADIPLNPGIKSSHSYGAAQDIGFPIEDDATVLGEVIGFLVGRSEELHVDAVHDYRRCRIWRAGRTPDVGDACGAWWKAQRPSAADGMGQSWVHHVHIEVTADGWADVTPIAERWLE